jgi:hypothetical protein
MDVQQAPLLELGPMLLLRGADERLRRLAQVAQHLDDLES